jgi:hypothetical protein
MSGPSGGGGNSSFFSTFLVKLADKDRVVDSIFGDDPKK